MATVLSFRPRQCLNPFKMLPFKGSFGMGLFGHISNYVFRSAEFRENISYEGRLFFENVQNLIKISKMEQQIQKKLLFLR